MFIIELKNFGVKRRHEGWGLVESEKSVTTDLKLTVFDVLGCGQSLRRRTRNRKFPLSLVEDVFPLKVSNLL